MTDKQKEQYDKWSKMDIYEAYLLENKTRNQLNKQLNDARLELKQLQYNIKQLSI